MALNEKQEELCSSSRWGFSDLRALFLNCTLKPSPELSHTQGLVEISKAIMEKNGVAVEVLRPVDYDIATGVYPDMTEHGWQTDQWPEIGAKVRAADILVLTSSIWLGEKTSAVLSGPGLGRTRKRFHQSQYDLHDLEPPAPCAHAQGRRRHSRPRQPALEVDGGLPL